VADRGEHGKGSNKHGEECRRQIILVPVGTVIKDAESGEVIADLDSDNTELMAAKAGRGGLGNSNFATATRQAPKFAQPEKKEKEKWLVLELKLLADVGLIGLPMRANLLLYRSFLRQSLRLLIIPLRRSCRTWV